jgi:tryptophan-rich sensory protein
MTRTRSCLALAGFLALSFVAAAVGSLWTSPAIPTWYQEITKPSWTPPSWLFGPVWTVLYIAMGVAAWLVWKRGGWSAQRGALTLFVVQLILNAAWSGLFFGMRSPLLGLAGIAALWIAILLTWQAFRRVSTAAAWLFVPYLCWVTFAAALNFSVWRLNG